LDRVTIANNDSDPSKVGIWEPIKYRFKHLPVHVALLHTGKVLAFGGSGNDETSLKIHILRKFLNLTMKEKMMDTSMRSQITIMLMLTSFVQDIPFFLMVNC
jgi:hypothetical protein